MYLPKIYQNFMKDYPGVFDSLRELGKACRESGPLDEKSQNLIKLGIAIGANAKGAVRSDTRKALESGASKNEIIQVVLLALTTTGLPNMIASMAWVNEVLEKES